MAGFEFQVVVDGDPLSAIEFLKRPANHCLISPPDMNLTYLKAPEVLELGSQFEFQVTGFGQVQQATHKVTSMSELSFTEAQVAGALKKFVSEHRCEATEDGKTLVIERVEFKPPGGLLGLIATEQRIKSRMEEAFQYRHESLKAALADSGC